MPLYAIRCGDRRDALGGGEVVGGEVEGQGHVLGPGRHRRERLAEQDEAEVVDQAGALGHRDEVDRRDEAEGRAVPARQRLVGLDPPGDDVDDRLEQQVELGREIGPAQRLLDLGLPVHPVLVLEREAGRRARRVCLGMVERVVGPLHQHFRSPRGLGEACEADRGADPRGAVAQSIGLFQHPSRASGRGRRDPASPGGSGRTRRRRGASPSPRRRACPAASGRPRTAPRRPPDARGCR